jgi:hypothetical protein
MVKQTKPDVNLTKLKRYAIIAIILIIVIVIAFFLLGLSSVPEEPKDSGININPIQDNNTGVPASTEPFSVFSGSLFGIPLIVWVIGIFIFINWKIFRRIL